MSALARARNYVESLARHAVSKLRHFLGIRLVSARLYIKRSFRRAFGYELDLNNPMSLNENIQWLKINDRTPLHTLRADKYIVRDYVKNMIGNGYLVPLVGHTKNADEISRENLPRYPIIIKTTHDSGTHFEIRDKNDTSIAWVAMRQSLKKALRRNYYTEKMEWQYKNIEPRIIIKKMLFDRDGKIPLDYKVHVMNQGAMMISVDLGRGTSVLSLKSVEQMAILSHLRYKGDHDANRTAHSKTDSERRRA